MKCKMYLLVAVLEKMATENGRHLGFLIGQSYKMDLITIVMSHAMFGDCITICTISPKNAYYLLYSKNLPQGKCYNMPQRHLAYEICNCRKIRCTLHQASYIHGSVYT